MSSRGELAIIHCRHNGDLNTGIGNGDEMKLGATTHKFRKLRKTRGIWESSAGKEWRYLENLRLLVNLANIMSLMSKVRDQYLDLFSVIQTIINENDIFAHSAKY